MKIEGGTHYILLRRIGLSRHLVFLYKKYDEVFSDWHAGDRVSSIFSVNNSEIPILADNKERAIFFMGPLHPGKLNCKGRAFLSLGMFNNILVADNNEEQNSIKDFINRNGVNWEKWHILGNEITEIEFNIINNKPEISKDVFDSIKIFHEELRGSLFEYRAQIASSISISSLLRLPLLDDILRFNILFKQHINLKADNENEDCVNKQGLITIANSVLGRQSEQIYSGTSPIFETEAHIGCHSLLGLGTASFAIQRIRSFIEYVFARADIWKRIELLASIESTSKPLFSIDCNDEIFQMDHLFDHPDQKKISIDKVSVLKDVIPLLTSFSGRDGFRSTEISISVPLAVLSGCNTSAWTLLTLTHEMVHVVIQQVLSKILPHPNKKPELESAVKILDSDFKKNNLFERIRELLCFSFWVVSREGKIQEEEIDTIKLAEIIRDKWSEISEILTHIFDFLYFYRGDEKHYVRSIWISWGVIPNIKNRIKAYIIRTLCALHAKNLRQQHERYQLTIDQCKLCLKEVLDNYPDSPYAKDAFDEINNNQELYLEYLKNRELLVKFVRFFLYSPEIQKMIELEPIVSGGDRGGYILEMLEFSDIRVINPVRFIEEWSRDKSSNKIRSVWMLQQLAFGNE